MICVLMKQLEMVHSIIATAVVILRHFINFGSNSSSVRFFSLLYRTYPSDYVTEVNQM